MTSEVYRETDYYTKKFGKYTLIGCYKCNSLFFTFKDFYEHQKTHKYK
ncbi:MAG: hypothetical protein QXM27_02890 [Candidatus Pacearchaeota archaeon]